MENVFLYNLYLKAPSFFKKKIINYINKAEGGQMYSPTLRKIYKEEHNIEIGYGSYGGCFSAGNVPPNVTFGNYCSIAQNIRIFRANHPKETFTSHPLLYNPIAGYVAKDQLDRPKLNIGHDVWIGEWSVILPGVKNIGNGAIIGAGSIVTKDVEPYSIMVGNSAKKIAKRFSDEVIESLEKTQWWNLNKDELIAVIDSLNSIARGGKAK